MSIRLEHANITVRDIDAAVHFITTALPDFHVRREWDDEGERWMHIGNDDTYIALIEANQESSQQREPYAATPGINHLGYEVDDVDALRERLSAAGFKDSTYPNNHPHRKRVYFYDTDGNDWEFVQYFSNDPAERNDYELADK